MQRWSRERYIRIQPTYNTFVSLFGLFTSDKQFIYVKDKGEAVPLQARKVLGS